MRNYLIVKLLFLVLFISSLSAKAQNSLLYVDEDFNFKTGVELFDNGSYALAQDYFGKVIQFYGDRHTDVKADAEYYSALCALALQNRDAEYRINQFVAGYPESPRLRMAHFEMGRHYYDKQKFDLAAWYFSRVWKQHLNREQLSELNFKSGYCYYSLENYERATKFFYEVLDLKETKYYSPAYYYYSHIAYANKNYETALNGFTELKDDETFAPLVPYYIVQIYYLQGKMDKVLEVGPPLLETEEVKREAEIARIIGEAYYSRQQYTEALPFLERYKQKARSYSRNDIYQLAYTYYMLKNYPLAISTFSTVTNSEDILTQNAFFHMADCYLKLGKKSEARQAFESAANSDFDGNIKEISLLNYAKLSYELSYSPFNETINAFNKYIATYPNSEHHDEAYSYLVKVFLTSKNYKQALASLIKIKVKSPEMKAAHQRVAYFRGLELFNNLQFEEAISAFELSANEVAFDKQMHALALYWKAEALYRLNEYQKAIDDFNAFLLTPGAYSLQEYDLTYYNMGYAFFKLKDYKKAISWFRKYTDKGTEVEQVRRGDAFIRIADCFFVSKQYTDALEFYGNAVNLGTFDLEYALFQKGFVHGLLRQPENKIETLSQLLAKNPQSNYAADALYERGRSYVDINSSDSAISDFNLLVKNYSNSSYLKRALIQLGLLYYAKEQYHEALASYKKVVEDYPGSSEAQDALLGIKNIYVDLNDVNQYFAYAEGKSGVQTISETEKDSLTYLAAEKTYMQSNWEAAATKFSQYLSTYDKGRYVLNANYYRADAYARLNKPDSALSGYLYVIEKPKNLFTERSMLNAALIQHDQNNYAAAFNSYKLLEDNAEIKSNLLIARLGMLDCAFADSNHANVIEAGQRLLITQKVPEETVRAARLKMGKSFRALAMQQQAITEFRILALDAKSPEGAEAKFYVAEMLEQEEKLVESEEQIMEFLSSGTSHQYWLAKSFLLLSDIYLKRNDGFQAKANLQSLINNYGSQTDGIIDEAKTKLAGIVDEENESFVLPESTGTQPTDSIINQ